MRGVVPELPRVRPLRADPLLPAAHAARLCEARPPADRRDERRAARAARRAQRLEPLRRRAGAAAGLRLTLTLTLALVPALIPHPSPSASQVPLPGFVCDVTCALVLGARSGGGALGATDHHWVDNLRMSGPPGRPAPPVLVNATATSLLLAWFPPHHGGEEVLLRPPRPTPTPRPAIEPSPKPSHPPALLLLLLSCHSCYCYYYSLLLLPLTPPSPLSPPSRCSSIGCACGAAPAGATCTSARAPTTPCTTSSRGPPTSSGCRLHAPRPGATPTHPPTHPHACVRPLVMPLGGWRTTGCTHPSIPCTHLRPPTSVTHPPHPPTAPTHAGRRRTTPTAGASRAPPPPSPPSRGHWPARPRRRACRASMRARACAAGSSTWREASPSGRAAAWVARCASSLGVEVGVGVGVGGGSRVTPPHLPHACERHTPYLATAPHQLPRYDDTRRTLPSYHPSPGASAT